MINRTAGIKFIALLSVFIVVAGSSVGYGAPPNALSDKIDELLAVVEKQSQQIKEQQQAFAAQEKRFVDYQQKMEKLLTQQRANISELQSRVGVSDGMQQAKAASSPASVAGQPMAKVAPARPPASPEVAGPVQPVGRPPEPPKESRPPEVAAIFDQPGVLTPAGALILEPSLQYTHSTSKRLFLRGLTIIPALHIGVIDLRDVRNNAYVAALAGRYGLTNRLELELKIPYVYRTEETSSYRYVDPNTIDETTTSNDGDGLGDIEFGLRYQLNQPQNGPYYIAGLRVKSDTGDDPFEVSDDELPIGSGFWGVQPNLSAVFSSDPAVFFGGVNYLYNITRDVGGDYGEIDPGDAYGFNFGMGLSLNEKAAFSMGYEHSVISRTKQDGDVIPGQVNLHVGSFQTGYSYRLNDQSSFNLSLGVGVTEDAPDVQLTLKLPITL